MSFVVLVISDEVENLSNSAFEKLSMLVNKSFLIVLHIPAATLDAKKLTIIVKDALSRETPSIVKPVFIIKLLSPTVMPLFIMSDI